MRDDLVYLQHIADAISDIEKYTDGGRQDFFDKKIIQKYGDLTWKCQIWLSIFDLKHVWEMRAKKSIQENNFLMYDLQRGRLFIRRPSLNKNIPCSSLFNASFPQK